MARMLIVIAAVLAVSTGIDIPDNYKPTFKNPITCDGVCKDKPPPITDCECSGDVLIMVDRSGSGREFNNIKSCVADLVDSLDPNCFSTALTAFKNKPSIMYDFGADASSDPEAAKGIIEMIGKPKGNTRTDLAFDQAVGVLNGDGNDPARCDVIVLFTDGGSEDKAKTIASAKNLRDSTNAWVCVVGATDEDATDQQKDNRAKELEDIVNNSAANSQIAAEFDFGGDVPPGPELIDQIKSCICQDC